MTIELKVTVRTRQRKEASAQFYVRVFGFTYDGLLGHFAPVRIASQALSLDFVDRAGFGSLHFAFKVGEAEFVEIFEHVKAEGLVYGSGPSTPTDMKTNNWGGGHGVYFRDPNGHLLELLTRDYTPDLFADS